MFQVPRKVAGMKRWITHCVIVVYLGALCAGIGAHALNVGLSSHPGIYYIVWDMFCGWSTHTSRFHLVAEGDSGKYYALTPAPWGEIHPYGAFGRRHYDIPARHLAAMGHMILEHTQHEDMTRIFVVEESWHKKYNLPDSVWEQLHDEPKDAMHYFHVRQVATPDGVVVQNSPTWLHRQFALSLSKNPRMKSDMQRSRPFYAISQGENSRSRYSYQGVEDPAASFRVGSALGN